MSYFVKQEFELHSEVDQYQLYHHGGDNSRELIKVLKEVFYQVDAKPVSNQHVPWAPTSRFPVFYYAKALYEKEINVEAVSR